MSDNSDNKVAEFRPRVEVAGRGAAAGAAGRGSSRPAVASGTRAGVPGVPGREETSLTEVVEALPEGVFHLLIADEDLAIRAYQRRITLCGAVVQPADLPPSCPGEGEELGPDPWYCQDCVREALRWSESTLPVEQDGG